MPYKYHTDLLKLGEKYPNMTVIPGGSSLSTYALIDRADVVVVWGSTTGAEAVYHGKPVILLGGAVYRELGITYNPENEEELHRLLLQSVLPPKDRTNAIKMGFYTCNIFHRPLRFGSTILRLIDFISARLNIHVCFMITKSYWVPDYSIIW